MDQSEDRIGFHFRAVVFKPMGIEIPAIGIRERDQFGVSGCFESDLVGFIGVTVPEFESFLSEVVFEIQQ